ncbi:FIST domain-containing protein [[Candida] zeylanoides]
MVRFVRHLTTGWGRARTWTSPAAYRLDKLPEDKAAIILATPSCLELAIDACSRHHEVDKSTQMVVAGVDSLLNSRVGISELWLANRLEVTHADELDDARAPPKQSDGVNVVSAKENWKPTKASLGLEFASLNVEVSLANTLFSTGYLTSLFYIDQSSALSGRALQNLGVRLAGDASVLDANDSWTPLYDYSKQNHTITRVVGNLIKGINDKSASSFLQENDKLMAIGSKDTQVFVKIYKKSQAPQRFEIIAGGGEWGVKASTLVISPQAQVAVGDGIEFYMLTPENRKARAKPLPEGLVARFECCPEQDSYAIAKGTETTVNSVFAAGSETGFSVNGVQHRSAGEQTTLRLPEK